MKNLIIFSLAFVAVVGCDSVKRTPSENLNNKIALSGVPSVKSKYISFPNDCVSTSLILPNQKIGILCPSSFLKYDLNGSIEAKIDLPEGEFRQYAQLPNGDIFLIQRLGYEKTRYLFIQGNKLQILKEDKGLPTDQIIQSGNRLVVVGDGQSMAWLDTASASPVLIKIKPAESLEVSGRAKVIQTNRSFGVLSKSAFIYDWDGNVLSSLKPVDKIIYELDAFGTDGYFAITSTNSAAPITNKDIYFYDNGGKLKSQLPYPDSSRISVFRSPDGEKIVYDSHYNGTGILRFYKGDQVAKEFTFNNASNWFSVQQQGRSIIVQFAGQISLYRADLNQPQMFEANAINKVDWSQLSSGLGLLKIEAQYSNGKYFLFDEDGKLLWVEQKNGLAYSFNNSRGDLFFTQGSYDGKSKLIQYGRQGAVGEKIVAGPILSDRRQITETPWGFVLSNRDGLAVYDTDLQFKGTYPVATSHEDVKKIKQLSENILVIDSPYLVNGESQFVTVLDTTDTFSIPALRDLLKLDETHFVTNDAISGDSLNFYDQSGRLLAHASGLGSLQAIRVNGQPQVVGISKFPLGNGYTGYSINRYSANGSLQETIKMSSPGNPTARFEKLWPLPNGNYLVIDWAQNPKTVYLVNGIGIASSVNLPENREFETISWIQFADGSLLIPSRPNDKFPPTLYNESLGVVSVASPIGYTLTYSKHLDVVAWVDWLQPDHKVYGLSTLDSKGQIKSVPVECDYGSMVKEWSDLLLVECAKSSGAMPVLYFYDRDLNLINQYQLDKRSQFVSLKTSTHAGESYGYVKTTVPGKPEAVFSFLSADLKTKISVSGVSTSGNPYLALTEVTDSELKIDTCGLVDLKNLRIDLTGPFFDYVSITKIGTNYLLSNHDYQVSIVSPDRLVAAPMLQSNCHIEESKN